MDSAGIMSSARLLAGGVSESQISPENMLLILNKSYKELYKRIVNLDRSYFRDRRTTNVVAGQYEYSLLKPVAGTYGIFKPEKLKIKYTNTQNYMDVTFVDRNNIEETSEQYALNQSTDMPVAIITDNKYIHIFPTPTTSVVGGLIIEGAKEPYELTITSTESEILIDPLYHNTIATMMCTGIYKYKQLFDRKNDSEAESEREIQKTLKSMGIVKTSVIRGRRPDLSMFE